MAKSAKIPSTFRLSDDVKKLLTKLAAKDDRSEAYIIEQLVKARAKELNITVE